MTTKIVPILFPDLFEDTLSDEELTTFVNDPLAIALLRNEGNGDLMMHEIDSDKNTIEYINNGNYLKQADEIRSYYRKRLFYGSLNKKFSTTRFRNDLYRCLEREDIFTLQHNEIGMIARLPDFYYEDITRDLIVRECDTSIPDKNSFWTDKISAKYLTKTRSRFGKNRTYCYWFKIENNKALCFFIDGTNPFINLFEDYLEPGKVLQLQGGFSTRVQDGVFFYQGKCKVLV